MFTSLIHEVRIWPVVWRRRFDFYRRHGSKRSLAFVPLLALPFVMLGSIIWFAYSRPAPVDIVHVEAAQREARYQRIEDLRCLAENVYFEARGEPLDGQLAVAEVTLNRMRSPYFPKSVCGVVHEARWDPIRRRFVAHFSWTELDVGSAPPDGPAWEQAMKVAQAAYDSTYQPLVPGALFYHATRIKPTWSKSQKVVTTIGKHVFYR